MHAHDLVASKMAAREEDNRSSSFLGKRKESIASSFLLEDSNFYLVDAFAKAGNDEGLQNFPPPFEGLFSVRRVLEACVAPFACWRIS